MKEQEFFEKMAAVWLELSNLHEKVNNLDLEMRQLEQAGIVNATIHTRSDNGGLELLHPVGSDYEREHGRRREYIGKKPEAQAAARGRVLRYQQHSQLKHECQKTIEQIKIIERRIDALEQAAFGRQAKLFSEMGTVPSSPPDFYVPKDWNWLTPQMVIDYFKQSPVLATMADDVQAVLNKVDWAEHQQAA